MLPSAYRLKKKKDIEDVLKSGHGFSLDGLTLKIKENRFQTRFAFIISKSVLRKAVERNKIRRQISEIIRKKLPLFKKNMDGVIILRAPHIKNDFRTLEETINAILKKAKLL